MSEYPASTNRYTGLTLARMCAQRVYQDYICFPFFPAKFRTRQSDQIDNRKIAMR
jgi:hypothetical protein